jgi:hypothetical protein
MKHGGAEHAVEDHRGRVTKEWWAKEWWAKKWWAKKWWAKAAWMALPPPNSARMTLAVRSDDILVVGRKESP